MAGFQMDMHGTRRVRVNARPELGLGEVFRVQESANQYLADVVFQVEGICTGAFWKDPQRGTGESGKICDTMGVEGAPS